MHAPARWPFMASAVQQPTAGAPNSVASPADWVQRCAARLAQLVVDEGVRAEDLRAVAAAMAEEPDYSALEPEAAAELHVQREA